MNFTACFLSGEEVVKKGQVFASDIVCVLVDRASETWKMDTVLFKVVNINPVNKNSEWRNTKYCVHLIKKQIVPNAKWLFFLFHLYYS